MHYAALADDKETVQILLENGAIPTAENDTGHLPKQYAKDPTIKKMLDAHTVKVIGDTNYLTNVIMLYMNVSEMTWT